MAGKALSLAFVCLSLLLCRTTGAAAHSLKEVQQAFEQESISPELVEVTKELEITAGMKSVREQVHARQHHILEQYVRARAERKCIESLTTISRLDQQIVDLRERGQQDEEQAQRKVRDATAAFITETCASTSLSK